MRNRRILHMSRIHLQMLNRFGERDQFDLLFTQRRFVFGGGSFNAVRLFDIRSAIKLHRLYVCTNRNLYIFCCFFFVANTDLFFASVHVECSANTMNVRLNYKNFNGRMFVAGYSEDCGISGRNQDVTTLVLPTSSDPRALNKCGVFVARSVGHRNRYVRVLFCFFFQKVTPMRLESYESVTIICIISNFLKYVTHAEK